MVGLYKVFQVGGEGGAVGGWAGARQANALGDVEDDAGEAVLVQVDLLVVGDLAEGAITVRLERARGARGAYGT
jgi:hypothetical protein